MDKKSVVEIVKRMVLKGNIFEAEVVCDDWGISRTIISEILKGEKS